MLFFRGTTPGVGIVGPFLRCLMPSASEQPQQQQDFFSHSCRLHFSCNGRCNSSISSNSSVCSINSCVSSSSKSRSLHHCCTLESSLVGNVTFMCRLKSVGAIFSLQTPLVNAALHHHQQLQQSLSGPVSEDYFQVIGQSVVPLFCIDQPCFHQLQAFHRWLCTQGNQQKQHLIVQPRQFSTALSPSSFQGTCTQGQVHLGKTSAGGLELAYFVHCGGLWKGMCSQIHQSGIAVQGCPDMLCVKHLKHFMIVERQWGLTCQNACVLILSMMVHLVNQRWMSCTHKASKSVYGFVQVDVVSSSFHGQFLSDEDLEVRVSWISSDFICTISNGVCLEKGRFLPITFLL